MNNLKKYKISEDSCSDEGQESISILRSKIMTEVHPIESVEPVESFEPLPEDCNYNQNSFLQSQYEGNEPFENHYKYNKNNKKGGNTQTSPQPRQIISVSDDQYHHIQILDEDVENFKHRLDIALKTFRSDSLKDFMSIKRHLLAEQKAVIESEKQKCDALLCSKTDQIEHLKESLAQMKNSYLKLTEVKENLAGHIYKIKNNKYITKLKSLAFIKCLKNYYQNKIKNKKVFEKLRGKLISKLKRKSYLALKSFYNDVKFNNIIINKDKSTQEKLNEMSQFYGKEINDLRIKLQEANQTIDKYKESKNLIQENLKKALMRGVVAMNLEAMNVLDEDGNSIYNNKLIDIDKECTTNSNSHSNLNNNFSNVNNMNPIPFVKEERKVVVKDNNWINACAVPSKMKLDIIKNSNSEFEYDNEYNYNYNCRNDPENESESSQHKMNLNKNPITHDYYEELTKNLSNIRSDFDNIVKTGNPIPHPNSNLSSTSNNNNNFYHYPHFSNLNDSYISSQCENSLIKTCGNNVSVNLNAKKDENIQNLVYFNSNIINNSDNTNLSSVSTGNNMTNSRKNINNTCNNLNSNINNTSTSNLSRGKDKKIHNRKDKLDMVGKPSSIINNKKNIK